MGTVSLVIQGAGSEVPTHGLSAMPEAKNLAAMLEDLQKAQKVCGAACVRAGPPARALAARSRQRGVTPPF